MTKSEQVLNSLRNNVEGNEVDGFCHVYLDNAKPAGMSANEFRACLRVLSEKGLYRVVDGYAWGDVKMKGV